MASEKTRKQKVIEANNQRKTQPTNPGARRNPRDSVGVDSCSLHMCRPSPIRHVVFECTRTQPALANTINTRVTAATYTSAHKVLAARTARGHVWTSHPTRTMYFGLHVRNEQHAHNTMHVHRRQVSHSQPLVRT